MKIIISHDVDHLYPSDHFFKDLIFPKLWVRSLLEFLKKEISLYSLIFRFISIFDGRLNRIPEIIAFDNLNGVSSTFFFGMANALGLSYSLEKAQLWINYVLQNDFDVGVHGIDYENPQKEYALFKRMTGLNHFGIRTHYVRYNSKTFMKFADVGYSFDCSEFNKTEIMLKDVYKINSLWEFPLHIMDGYVLKNGLDNAKKLTEDTLEIAETRGIKYFSLLFHDYMYNGKTYPIAKEYYEWFVYLCKTKGYSFISYRSAIDELENRESI
jgi:hypothetical protein